MKGTEQIIARSERDGSKFIFFLSATARLQNIQNIPSSDVKQYFVSFTHKKKNLKV